MQSANLALCAQASHFPASQPETVETTEAISLKDRSSLIYVESYELIRLYFKNLM